MLRRVISGTCDVDGRSRTVEMGDLIDEVGGKSKRGKQAPKLSTHHDIEINVIINLVYNISSEPTELAQFSHSVASGMQMCPDDNG